MTSHLAEVPNRVLIVEDDAFMAELLVFMLARQGLAVERLADGADAMARINRSCDIDLVLLDLLLPRHGGFEVLAQMRRQAGWERVPVLVLSALDKGEDIARAFQLGADDFVTKPFNPDEFWARVQRLLRQYRPEVRP